MNKQLAGTLIAGAIGALLGSTARNLSKQEGWLGIVIVAAGGAAGTWIGLKALK